ncbi:TonB-dependent receptor SusC [bacterium HR18]|uniref:TonB-dependent receptor n=1 Tax=Rhodothermus marinus TaxID=29549 RepID=A0A7V2F7P4_RHOMR|nr:TonB-dependent receptor SusC [bacterium HR18]
MSAPIATYRLQKLGLLVFLLLWTLPAQAQGSLAGRVRDERGEPLPGVNVIVVGTAYGAATDLEGRFRIDGLRPGEYSVRVSFVGFETVLFTGVRVREGEVTALEVTLREQVVVGEEVVVVGARPLIDVEQSSSAYVVSREQIEAAPLRSVQEVVGQQAGVLRDPTGLYIRGGRAYETGYYVDGVSARDPLAGTGFGLDLGTNAFQEVEVITGGLDARYGDVTSGVVSIQTREGGERFSGTFTHKRDNFGSLNESWGSNFHEDLYELTFGGPLGTQKLRFFAAGQVQLSDGFTRHVSDPDSVRSSLVRWNFLLPRANNRWNGFLKLTYAPWPGLKLQGAYQRSLTVNQNTRMLQVTGNEAVVAPGFQYAFILQPENANTFAHDNVLAYLKASHVINERSFYEVQLSRLFTRLRADANGRRWRPRAVTSELDPSSIVTYPAALFVDENGQPFDPNALFVLPGPGLFNNGGIATRFHDHFAEEWTLLGSYTLFSVDRNHRLNAGLEVKLNDYQWIDVIRPWVGAPIGSETAEATGRLGESADIWRVKPRRGALFATGQVRYRGLILNTGLRLEWWSPGRYVDRLVEDPRAPILETVRQAYKDGTVPFLGLRTKFFLLPRLRVSFPIRENQVLFFNYGRSTRLPHPTFVYAGLDPFYQDRSFFADLGNPNLNPEVDISYELGLRYQLSSNDVLSLTAFWRDKYDFITVENVVIRDPTGRETVRAFRINGDFARVRGLEASYLKRIGDWFLGQIAGTFSRATGLSSTNNDALVQFLARGDIENTFETPLAWDRPLDVKASVTFTYDRPQPLLGLPGLNRLQVFLSSTFRSGQRYTPAEFKGYQTNPFTGEPNWRPIYELVSAPTARYSRLGEPWWWFDLALRRRIRLGRTDLELSLEVTNLFNQKNSVIINPVTGKAYPDVDPQKTNFAALRGNRNFDVPIDVRDPRYEDPRTAGLPPLNPARFLPPRHVLLGISYAF